MAGGPNDRTLIDRLSKPPMFPEAFSEVKVLQQRMVSKAKKAQAFRALADAAKQPAWQEVRKRTSLVISDILERLPNVFGAERDQLIGEMKAWRDFASAPDEALEIVRKLDSEIGEIQASLGKPVKA